MKRNFLTLLAFVMIIGFTTTSCKKDDDNPTPPTKKELLTDGTWEGVSIRKISKANGVTVSDNTTKIEHLTVTFTNDGKLTTTNTDIEDGNGTWSFLKNETVLKLNIESGATQLVGNDINGEMDMNVLNSSKLQLSGTLFEVSSLGIENEKSTTITFKR